MRISLYVLKDFLVIFFTALLIVTFTMCLLSLPKLIDVMSRGIDLKVSYLYIFNLISYILSYAIPISALFSSLLLFGRLSVDNELNAMRSSGLSLWQISSPVVLIGVILSIFCIYNNSFIYPHKRYANRVLIQDFNTDDPIKVLDEGRSIRDFPGYIIYIKEKKENRVTDLIIYEIDKKSGSVESCIQSKEGKLILNNENKTLFVELYEARIEQLNRNSTDELNENRYASATNYTIPLDITKWTKSDLPPRGRRDMTLPELIWNARSLQGNQSLLSGQYWVRVHQRIYLGMAPLTFVLIAIPLGIRTQRKESATGMLLSLCVIFIYYCLVLVADGLDNKPEIKPWLIPWTGTLIAQLVGLFLIKKMN